MPSPYTFVVNLVGVLKRILREAPKVIPRYPKISKMASPRANLTKIASGTYGLACVDNESEALNKSEEFSTRFGAWILHVFYEDVALEIIAKSSIPEGFDVLLTGPDLRCLERIRAKIPNRDVYIFLTENTGRDILPFLLLCDLDFMKRYTCFIKLHTKKSPHLDYGNDWREKMLKILSLAVEDVEAYLDKFIGKPFLIGAETLPVTHRIMFNFFWMKRLTKDTSKIHSFIPGSMFIGNAEAIAAIASANLLQFSSEKEMGQLDGTFAHAVERFLGVIVEQAGGIVLNLSGRTSG